MMVNHMTSLVLLACFLCLGPGWCTLGCSGPSYRTTYIRTVRQAAVAPAPGGPHAMGRQLQKRGIALEGGFTDTVTQPGKKSRDIGQPGQVLLNKGIRIRAAYGAAAWFEVGLELDVMLPGEGSSLTSDLRVSQEADEPMLLGGPQFRFQTTWRPVTLGASVEISFSSLPYRWEVIEQVQSENLTTPGQGTSTSSNRTQSRGSLFYLYTRFTLSGTAYILPGLTTQLGFMLHNHPLFFGKTQVTEVCDNYSGCSGENLDDIDHTKTIMLGTFFLSATVDIFGPLMAVGQIFVHAAGDNQLLDSGRFGGDVALRLVF